jgi:hypothetical protein
MSNISRRNEVDILQRDNGVKEYLDITHTHTYLYLQRSALVAMVWYLTPDQTLIHKSQGFKDE